MHILAVFALAVLVLSVQYCAHPCTICTCCLLVLSVQKIPCERNQGTAQIAENGQSTELNQNELFISKQISLFEFKSRSKRSDITHIKPRGGLDDDVHLHASAECEGDLCDILMT